MSYAPTDSGPRPFQPLLCHSVRYGHSADPARLCADDKGSRDKVLFLCQSLFDCIVEYVLRDLCRFPAAGVSAHNDDLAVFQMRQNLILCCVYGQLTSRLHELPCKGISTTIFESLWKSHRACLMPSFVHVRPPTAWHQISQLSQPGLHQRKHLLDERFVAVDCHCLQRGITKVSMSVTLLRTSLGPPGGLSVLLHLLYPLPSACVLEHKLVVDLLRPLSRAVNQLLCIFRVLVQPVCKFQWHGPSLGHRPCEHATELCHLWHDPPA
mmetsp:Transcript_9086/g.27321  ORF Transcript_9086/g.27321 Transcript_9086/m.27321 type:complete len:267 (+) Transcript_9086:2986-3786(+)